MNIFRANLYLKRNWSDKWRSSDNLDRKSTNLKGYRDNAADGFYLNFKTKWNYPIYIFPGNLTLDEYRYI